jgi:DNA-binding PadR family transcriptional regulator
MSINHAILGILSCRSVTGYDLKKIIQESPFMPWSGNNNQIYKALVEILDEGFVTHEVLHQESSPSKKIYTITEEGLAELKDWVLSSPEPPECKKAFLIQLAWAEQLNAGELDSMLVGYGNELKTQILMQKEKQRRGLFSPARSARETYLWDMIYENIISSYENELHWLKKLRAGINSDHGEERNKMNYKAIEKNTKKYVECLSTEKPIHTEQDALDLIAACGEHDTNLLMIHAEAFSEEFFKLRTGLAGMILQKFINYRVRTAVVLQGERKFAGKFKEFLAEANKGKDFRVFNSTEEAENWLISY